MRWALLLLFVACSQTTREKPACSPLMLQAMLAAEREEGLKAIERGECDGRDADTCPALVKIRERYRAALDAWETCQ
jgi:hypothetical protein